MRIAFAIAAVLCFLAAFCSAAVPTFWIFALLEPIRKYAIAWWIVAGLVLGAFAAKGRRT